MEKTNFSWKPCMKSWNIRSIGMEIMAIVFLVVITAYPFVLGAMEGETVPLFAAIGAPVLGMMSFLFFSFAVAFERRCFQMNEEGITILYCGQIRRFYPWTMFGKIVVCDVDHATKFPENCSVVIRLAALEEPYGPHSKKQKYNISGIASWRKYNYSIRYFSKILFLEYSPALLDDVVRVSGLPFTFSLTDYGKAKLESNAISSKKCK